MWRVANGLDNADIDAQMFGETGPKIIKLLGAYLGA